MEENKNNKVLIWLVSILVILVLGLIGFVIYDKVLKVDKNIPNNDETTTLTTTKKNIINSEFANVFLKDIEHDFKNYQSLYWDYEEIYNEFFTLAEEDIPNCSNEDYCNTYYDIYGKNFNFKSYNFVKINDGKLYWLIDNNWTLDKNISNNIRFFAIFQEENYIFAFDILTEENEFYHIDIENPIRTDDEVGDKKDIVLSSVIYNTDFKYENIELVGKVSNIVKKYFPADCDAVSSIVAKINEELYILSDTKFYNLKDYYEKESWLKYINYFDNTCNPPFGYIVNIKMDGSLENVVDENNNKIYAKYYIQLFSENYYSTDQNENKQLYDLIIDNNYNSYIIDRNIFDDTDSIKKLKKDEKVKKVNIKTPKDSRSYIESIEFENGKKIVLSLNQNY